ncbi:MAG: hypothetical protein WCG75_11420 [Armatimonadota bacterium]
MKSSFAILALVAIGAVGCKGGETNNSPAPVGTANSANSPASNNAPATNNAPETNNAAAANNTAEANNAPSTKTAVTKSGTVTSTLGPELVNPKGPGEDSTWKKNEIDAKKLAEIVDATMKSVKDVKMTFHLEAELPEHRGFFEDKCIIADQSRFYLNYANFVPGRNMRFDTFLVRRLNGSKDYSTYVVDKYVPGRIAPDPDTLNGWMLGSTHYICSGVGTTKKPFTDLVIAAQKAKWKISVEEKKFDKSSFQRIIMESPSSSKAPKRRYELMIHPQKLLPVSFYSVIFDKKRTIGALDIAWQKSDKPLTEADLNPVQKVDPVKVLTPEEAAKQGLKPSGN